MSLKKIINNPNCLKGIIYIINLQHKNIRDTIRYLSNYKFTNLVKKNLNPRTQRGNILSKSKITLFRHCQIQGLVIHPTNKWINYEEVFSAAVIFRGSYTTL